MASEYHRLLDPRALSASETQSDTDAYDGGGFSTIEAQVRVLAAGSAGNIKLQHAAVLEKDAWKDVTGGAVALNATTNVHVSITNFLRYLRWVTDGSVAGSPVVLIDLVAKE